MVLIGYASYAGAQSMGYNWQWNRVTPYLLKISQAQITPGVLIDGLCASILLSSAAFAIAIVVGAVVASLRQSELIVGSWTANIYLEFIRNMPLLVLLYLFYYVLGPIFGMDRYWASILCLAAFHGALISEIFRAGLASVPEGQWEAGRSLGLTTPQVYRFILVPQALRVVVPPLTNEAIHLIKNSSIVSVIAVVELTTVGRNIISKTYMSFEIWLTVAAIYLCATLLLTMFASWIESRLTQDPRATTDI